MKNKSIRFIIVLSIVLFIIVLLADVNLNHKPKKIFDYSIESYNSRGDQPLLLKNKLSKKAKKKDLKISFKVKPANYKSPNPAFQTSPTPYGINLVILDNSNIKIYIPYKDNNNIKYKIITAPFILDAWNDIQLNINQNKNIYVAVNNNIIFNEKVSAIKYEITDFIFGGNQQKKFLGEIKEIKLECKAVKKIVVLDTFLTIIEMVLVLFFLYCIILLLYNPENKISLAVLIVLVGFIISVFFHYVKSAYLGYTYPHNTFLFIPDDSFNDFFCLMQLEPFNPYLGKIASAQYPLVNFIGSIFSYFNKYIALATFNFFCLSCLIVFSYRTLYSLNRPLLYTNIIVFSILNYPILFAIDRGNYELLVMSFLILFIICFQKDKFTLGGLFLSISIALKVYPAVFLLLYLVNKKYKSLCFTISFLFIIQLLILVLLKGGLIDNITFILKGTNYNSVALQTFIINNNVVQRGVSIYSVIKIFLIELKLIDSINLFKYLHFYIATSGIVIILLSLFIYFKERELWKQVTILTIIMLLFPHISADYKLIHILIPFLLFLNSKKRYKFDAAYLFLFSFLIIPKDYFFFSRVISDAGVNDISLASVANPLFMIIIIVLILFDKPAEMNYELLPECVSLK